MLETKEQIRTELINELIEWNDNFDGMMYFGTLKDKLLSMLPPETPEKIAERKAEEMMSKKDLRNITHCLVAEKVKPTMDLIQSMLIEALLTDIKK